MDGTGAESIFRITAFTSNDPVVTDFKWTTINNNTLKLEFEDDTVEEYSYSLILEENRLILISATGNSREFFKTE